MKREHRPRVLVLDADLVPCLTISRSLSRRGCTVDAASHTLRPLSRYSNAVNTIFQYPDPMAAPEAFVDWLLEHVRTTDYDLVIPVTERTLVVLSERRERLSHINIAMPEAASLEVALDKAQTLELADRVGVPRPLGVTLTSIDDLGELKKVLKFPVVLKPARSIGSAAGGASQLQVSYAFDVSELQAGCAHALQFGPVLLQEFFWGIGVGVELIARQGKIGYAFQHRRLHEVPLTGGGSSLRVSEPVTPRLLEASERLIAALNWSGVAMVEFKLDPRTQDFCLMEINGRFWGSLPLAVAAGADFPSMLLDLELDDELKPCKPYRNNIYCRLLSRDLAWYEAVLRGGTDGRIASIPSRWDVVKGLGLFLNPGHRFDVQGIRDPLPGIADVSRLCKGYVQRLLTLANEMRFFSRQRRAWKNGEVSRAISQAGSMLFLCYGNINRSALADVMVRAYAEDSGISVISAGFHRESGRPADPVMVEVAAQHGIDMKAIRSCCVTEQQLRDSDIIFVMEKAHYDRLRGVDASIAEKVYLLGAHRNHAGWPVEIADPYGQSRASYQACYERIAEAVDHIKAVIAESASD
ncbi:MAG: ATP-grasp domain-containing protein [Halioglobus sp.]|nr:ATP-grasp domain-containing protein [Halioglobus sp.]